MLSVITNRGIELFLNLVNGVIARSSTIYLYWDLELDGESDLHEELICEIIGEYTIEGE